MKDRTGNVFSAADTPYERVTTSAPGVEPGPFAYRRVEIEFAVCSLDLRTQQETLFCTNHCTIREVDLVLGFEPRPFVCETTRVAVRFLRIDRKSLYHNSPT